MVWLAWDGANALNIPHQRMHLASCSPRIQGLSHLVLHFLPHLWFGSGKFLQIGVEGVVQPQHLGTLW